MQPGQMAYDRAITVFSPDGRLFQVEYARVAVTRGNTTVGLKFKKGIVLMADKKIGSRLVETSSIEKIFQIDEHVGAATSGLVADARVLVDYARLVAQINKVTYSEKIGVDLLVKRICDYKQNYTQYGGVRPFGTALLVAGVDDLGTHLFETDPSGALVSYKAGRPSWSSSRRSTKRGCPRTTRWSSASRRCRRPPRARNSTPARSRSGSSSKARSSGACRRRKWASTSRGSPTPPRRSHAQRASKRSPGRHFQGIRHRPVREVGREVRGPRQARGRREGPRREGGGPPERAGHR